MSSFESEELPIDVNVLLSIPITWHGSYQETADRTVVIPIQDDHTGVILAFGQSNAANEGDPEGLYECKHDVLNFNFMDGKCYRAKGRLIGPTDKHANFLTRLGDRLIERGLYKCVILIPIGHGGTFMHHWGAWGVMNSRMMYAVRMAQKAGLVINTVLCQQGEAEGSWPYWNIDNYVKKVWEVALGLRCLGVTAPLYLAQCSAFKGIINNDVRRAQRKATETQEYNVLLGPDTDTITDRYDGIHFSTEGLEKAAQLWADVLYHG
jgi:Carbohydrate esterase, sialic acid-specific acetylesterase